MPPVNINPHIYCDESYTHKSVSFAIGGLFCSEKRARILKDELTEVRNKHNYKGELKWKKIRTHNLNIYLDFIGVFVNNRHARLQ